MKNFLFRFWRSRKAQGAPASPDGNSWPDNFSIAPTAKINPSQVSNPERGRLSIGAYSIVKGRIVFEGKASVQIGERTFIGYSVIDAYTSVSIGNDVLISWGCDILDHDSHALEFALRKNDVLDWYHGRKDWSHVKSKPVIIQDKVWIGLRCIILKGVTIGEGSVIAAGSLVIRDVPSWTLVGGSPARIIRQLSPDSVETD